MPSAMTLVPTSRANATSERTSASRLRWRSMSVTMARSSFKKSGASSIT
jgi:hypothetical protein